jgi:hypothetical protein
LRKSGDPEAAQAALKTALEVARQQAAQGYELLILQSICSLSEDIREKAPSVDPLKALSDEAGGHVVNPSISPARDVMPGK